MTLVVGADAEPGLAAGVAAALEHDRPELESATREVLSRLLSAGGELVTLVVGADATPGLAARVAAALERDRPDVEVVVLDGGQPVYPMLVGVE